MTDFYISFELYNTEEQDSWCKKVIEEQDLFIDFENSQDKKIVTSKKASLGKDYRESEISIFGCDSDNIMNYSNSREPLKAKYMGYGVVKLFREYEDLKAKTIEVDSDDTTVAIVAVPAYMSPTDLLAFLGEAIVKNISHFRLIKSESNNRFMVLMKFRKNDQARKFQDSFNGIPFNAMESERCHTIFVKSVIFKPLNKPSLGIPYLMEDPFTMQVKQSESSSVIKELPTCPVCLERMDSDISGLLTISCQHTFHCDCLSRWRDDTCPVCRYSNIAFDPLDYKTSDCCSSCGGTSNLWVCLICGNVGCGRYESKHAIEHYESTGHCFSMDIATQRVWDYAGDNYVHRLLQNEADGKLVELNSPSSSTCSLSDSKGKNLDYSIEYSNVLLSQLESQREYYESRLTETNYLSKQEISINEGKVADLERSLEELQKTVSELKTEKLNNKKPDNSEKMKKLAQALEKKWKDEQMISENLTSNVEKLKLENQELKSEKEELEEQVKDLMFFLESQEKFKNASEDVKNGTVIIKEKKKNKK